MSIAEILNLEIQTMINLFKIALSLLSLHLKSMKLNNLCG